MYFLWNQALYVCIHLSHKAILLQSFFPAVLSLNNVNRRRQYETTLTRETLTRGCHYCCHWLSTHQICQLCSFMFVLLCYVFCNFVFICLFLFCLFVSLFSCQRQPCHRLHCSGATHAINMLN